MPKKLKSPILLKTAKDVSIGKRITWKIYHDTWCLIVNCIYYIGYLDSKTLCQEKKYRALKNLI